MRISLLPGEVTPRPGEGGVGGAHRTSASGARRAPAPGSAGGGGAEARPRSPWLYIGHYFSIHLQSSTHSVSRIQSICKHPRASDVRKVALDRGAPGMLLILALPQLLEQAFSSSKIPPSLAISEGFQSPLPWYKHKQAVIIPGEPGGMTMEPSHATRRSCWNDDGININMQALYLEILAEWLWDRATLQWPGDPGGKDDGT